MQVRRNEGVATHIDPKPCAGIREDIGEASAGERTGQPSSRESVFPQGADAVSAAEGKTGGRASASVRPTLRGLRPWHVRKLFAREPGDLQFEHSHIGVVRIGKARSRCRASCQVGQNAVARKRDFHCLGCLGKSLLVSHSTMRTGRSYSPRTLVSNFIRLPTMPGRRRHVT